MIVRSNRFFVSHQANAQPDQELAAHFHNALSRSGHLVFIDRGLRSGDKRLTEIERQIRQSDFLIVLLSQESAHNEMIQAEVKWAAEYGKRRGRPAILPIRVAYDGPLPCSLNALLEGLQPLSWHDDQDNQRLIAEIIAATEDRLPSGTPN